jgi:hypothetical protein
VVVADEEEGNLVMAKMTAATEPGGGFIKALENNSIAFTNGTVKNVSTFAAIVYAPKNERCMVYMGPGWGGDGHIECWAAVLFVLFIILLFCCCCFLLAGCLKKKERPRKKVTVVPIAAPEPAPTPAPEPEFEMEAEEPADQAAPPPIAGPPQVMVKATRESPVSVQMPELGPAVLRLVGNSCPLISFNIVGLLINTSRTIRFYEGTAS